MRRSAGAIDVDAVLERVWRDESARIIGGVTRLVRDLSLAEELAQDAIVAALEHWPSEGVPDNPGAWLTTIAKRRAIDRLRQHALHAGKLQMLGHDADALGLHEEPDVAEQFAQARSEAPGDDALRLIFTACHPVLNHDAQMALTLRVVAGLTVAEIARAYVVPEPTISQRIVRAKRTLANARVPFEMPEPSQRAARLAAVLEVVYLIFNEGHAATEGEQWMRPTLCAEALRLARLLVGLAPQEAEVHGLAALLELQASRLPSRVDEHGQAVLLADQDRSRWDRAAIERGLADLDRAQTCATAHGATPGPYALQARIAAHHARAAHAQDTDWAGIVAAYDALLAAAPSPIVALNRAVAVSLAQGPQAALPLVEALDDTGVLARYHLLHAVRGDLLQRLGRRPEARAAFEHAAGLTRNAQEAQMLSARAQACG